MRTGEEEHVSAALLAECAAGGAAAAHEAARAHLEDGCAACGAEFRFWSRCLDRLRSAGEVTVPESVRRRALALYQRRED